MKIVIVIAFLLLVQFPVRVLVAEVLWTGAFYILDDPRTEHADIIAIDDKTYSQHMRADKFLRAAAFLVPSQPKYHRALGDLALLRARWTAVMEEMKAALPEAAVSSKEEYQKAEQQYQAALHLDLTDAGAHKALGSLYDQVDPAGSQAEREFDRAIALAPRSSQLRYSVAVQHLLAGRNGLALEHAGVLARIDEAGGYLYQAFEIAWRASGGDANVVQGLAIRAKDGEIKARKFLASKGM